MSIGTLLKKAFTGGDWCIAIRDIGDVQYHVISNRPNTWCADTLLFEESGEHYLFVEQYDKKKDKGTIGYYTLENGSPVNKGVIIENPYHMSYPFVFRNAGTVYMIPESSANSTVDLYIAEEFPEKWRLLKHLVNNEKYVDSTVWEQNGQYYVLTYKKQANAQTKKTEWVLVVFVLNMENLSVNKISERVYNKNVGRPAGHLFIKDGMLIRPAQDCSKKYGESIILYAVDSLNSDGRYIEHEVDRVLPQQLNIDKKIDRFHTYSRDEKYEVIDAYIEKIDVLHIPRIFLRSRRK